MNCPYCGKPINTATMLGSISTAFTIISHHCAVAMLRAADATVRDAQTALVARCCSTMRDSTATASVASVLAEAARVRMLPRGPE